MDIYEYLKLDHKKVDHLFKLFEDDSYKTHQKDIAATLTEELMVHAHAEQETFYQFLLQFPETHDCSHHGEKEHQDIENHIKMITNAKTPKQFRDHVLQLKELVEHHVKEEEGPMFRKAKKVISKEEALILKEKMHYLKGKFLLWLRK